MSWSLVWSETALKDLRKLDKNIARIIIRKTTEELDRIEEPRVVLTPLKYSRKGQYKYRIGSYRVICRLHDSVLIVEAITIGHRKDIYRK